MTNGYSHMTRHGMVRCASVDLKDPVQMEVTDSTTKAQVAEMVAQAIGYHAVTAWPGLNHFSGYDTLRFEFVKMGAP